MRGRTLHHIAIAALGAGLAAGASAPPATQPAAAPPGPRVEAAPAHPGWSRYDVVVRRNIFVHGSAPQRTDRDRERTPTRVSRPRVSLVLTGTVVLPEETVAFLENSETGVTTRIHAGQNVAGGRIVTIDADGIELESGSRMFRVALGSSVDGGPGAATMPSVAASAPAEGEAAGSAGTLGEDPVLQRMRARRAQEMGK